MLNISARNVLKGVAVEIKHGMVNSEVTLELPGGQTIVSMITKSSAERLGLEVGKEAYAVVKASSVMIATE